MPRDPHSFTLDDPNLSITRPLAVDILENLQMWADHVTAIKGKDEWLETIIYSLTTALEK